MNIENLLRALRLAKKLRKALPFHQRTIYGIDVHADEYQTVQSFVKGLFKSLKRADFDIQVNHWGEIILIEPTHEIKVSVSVSYAVSDVVVKEAIQKLESQHYFSIPDDSLLSPIMVCQFKLLRRGTKWHSFRLSSEASISNTLAERITEQIQERAAMLSPQVRYDYWEPLDVVTIQDVLALIRYGAAAFGTSSSLYFLSKDKHIFYPEKIIFENATLQLFNARSATNKYLLKPRELKLFQMVLPISTENTIELER